ncbi:MAG: tyrosine-type recombinase/integrase, partial [Chitinispirillia bacterium]
YSPKTINNYEHALVRLSKYHNKSPLYLTTENIEDYIQYALEVEQLAPTTVNLHIGAFGKFYNLMVPNSTVMDPISKVKEHKKLPTVLAAKEIAGMASCTNNLKHRSIIELLYSSGVRLSELVDLRPLDIDGTNKLVHVKCGKGSKERYTIISAQALHTLRQYYCMYRPKVYLFEGTKHEQYHKRSVDKVVKAAAKRTGIKKNVTPHTLRHSLATHLLEQNVNLRTIQKLLGHSNIKSTTIYTHVSTMTIANINNPLDLVATPDKNGREI